MKVLSLVPVMQSLVPGLPHGGSIESANTSPYNMKYGWKYT